MSILCTIFGHRPAGVNVKRMFAHCSRCDRGLKVSYDMSYGDTIVTGDYGERKTFCWCPKCDAELIEQGPTSGDESTGIYYYVCRNCGAGSRWDFNPPVPINIT